MNEEFRADYISRAFGEIVGKTVKSVRALSPAECAEFAWNYDNHIPWLIEFTDGTLAVPTSDPEGNGNGHLFILGYGLLS